LAAIVAATPRRVSTDWRGGATRAPSSRASQGCLPAIGLLGLGKARVNALDGLATVRAEALVEHYQKTREQLTRDWVERNRRYSLLVAMLAIAAMLSFVQGPVVQALGRLSTGELSTLLGRMTTLGNPELSSIVASLLVYNASVIFDLLMIALLVLAFYLMTDLFHRSSILGAGYVYLALMEREIRGALLLGVAHIAFTREGAFYQASGRRMSKLIGWANKGMLGALLVLFFAARLFTDFPQDWFPLRLPDPRNLATWPQWATRNFLFLLDVITALLTARMFWGYLVLKPPSEAKVRAAIAQSEQQS
jgi:hypothetical protein